ncbi:MAG: hypothetical protein AMJ53_01400 [Gammaproteobacteria bacterium SG8_11]|nr:MAG: hypothetical protein AMJ53_01400 [Gammaproteobacteria bacterium SG8_11]
MNQEEREAQKLHDLLKAPKAPVDLAEKLKANLERQVRELDTPVVQPKRQRAWWYGLAASLTIAVVVAMQFNSNPDVVTLAYKHAQEEADLMGTIDGGYQTWLEAAGLQMPSEANSIALSKNCALGEQKAKHLRFDLPSKGTINLFLYQDGDNLPNIVQAEGTIADLSWLTDSPRDDIRILALYDSSVNKSQITQIIQSMFKEQLA